MTSRRAISSANETALNQPVVRIVVYARLAFASGVQRFHTEIGPKTATHPVFGSETYLGLGDFGGISNDVVESITGAPRALKLALTGVDSSLLSTAMTDDYFRRDVDIMIGIEDAAGDPIDDPEVLFSGFMDKVDITLGEQLSAMEMTCESRATKLLTTPDWRYTDEDKQIEVPGDLAAEYIYKMPELDTSVSWPSSGQRPDSYRGPDTHR